jgi:hypothetical protein
MLDNGAIILLADSPAQSSLWQRPRPTPDERALELEEFERSRRASTRYLYLRYGFEYLIWLIVGLFLMYWSFHTTDTRYAGLAFWGGIGLGDAGMLLTLIRARNEAERCGLI